MVNSLIHNQAVEPKGKRPINELGLTLNALLLSSLEQWNEKKRWSMREKKKEGNVSSFP